MTTKTSRDEWARRVRRWERSGLSAKELAEREGWRAKALVWWRWRLRQDTTKVREDAPPPAFVRLEVPTPVGEATIEIALANGRVVRVPASFDDGVLVRVLAVAEAR